MGASRLRRERGRHGMATYVYDDFRVTFTPRADGEDGRYGVRIDCTGCEALDGEFVWGHNVALGYYDQHLSDLDPANEVIEEVGARR